MTELLTLPFAVQVSFGTGYLAYLLAYGGIRRQHDAADAVFLTFAFAALATVATWTAARWMPQLAAVATGFALTLAAAGFWRARGRKTVAWLVNRAGVHQDDGHNDAWSAMLDALPRQSVTQAAVHLANGRTLYCMDTSRYSDGMLRGLLLGTDGSVVMVVDNEDSPAGTEEQREDIRDPEWGTRVTYVPATSITRVDLRVKGR